MGTQISSVFPNGEIQDSETQLQFLRSIDSQNPKNAQPVSNELLDFNKQANNFVLFTCGGKDYVHYYQCQSIFVASFTYPSCPIPERFYHYHSFKGMNFITIHCNQNCYQVMNHFMDHVVSSITRNEFLSKVISEINSQSVKDLQDKNIKAAFNDAPQIRRASPSKTKKDDTTAPPTPSIKSIKRNLRYNREIEDNNSVEMLTKKSKKVSIQMPTLDSPHFTNTSMFSKDNEAITYDSVNISTSFTTDKHASDFDDVIAEEEPNNIKNKPKGRNQNNKNNLLLESDDEDINKNEMLSENSEEENECDNEDNDKKNVQRQNQIRAKNKILTHNNETGSVQSKLDNQTLSFANGSETAKSANSRKKNTLKMKKGTKRPQKINKGKKKNKKTGANNSKTTKKQSDNNEEDPNLQRPQFSSITKDAIINSNISAQSNIKTTTNNNNNNINNNIIIDNTQSINNINSNINAKYNSNRLNSNDNSKNPNNNFIYNNAKSANNNSNINNFTSNINKFNSKNSNNTAYQSNNSNNNNNNKYNSTNQNTFTLNNDKTDEYDQNQQTSINNENDDSNQNNIQFNNNKKKQTPTIIIQGQGKGIPLEMRHRQHIDKNANTTEEEENDEKIVKINLKYTNTTDSNNFSSKRSGNGIKSPNNTNGNNNEVKNSKAKQIIFDEIDYEEEEEINTNDSKDGNMQQIEDDDTPHIPVPRQIQNQNQSQNPKFQISDAIRHSKVPTNNSLIEKGDKNHNLQFSLSKPLEISKPEDKPTSISFSNQNPYLPTSQNKAGRMQVSHLIEISKFDKSKPKVKIDQIIAFSFPETETNSKIKKADKEKMPIQQRQIPNDNFNVSPDESDSDNGQYANLDERKNQSQKEPIIAVLTGQIQPQIKQKRRRHHHHKKVKLIEKESNNYDDQSEEDPRKKHHRRRHHHHHRNNSDNSDDDYNEYGSDDNNNRRSSPHRRHHHHHGQQKRIKKEYDNYDDYDDYANDHRLKRSKDGRRRNPSRSSPAFEKIDFTDKSTQLTPTKTVATSTSFFDKDTKQSQTNDSILNRKRESTPNYDYINKRETKSTNTNFSESDIAREQALNQENNEYDDEMKRNSMTNRISQTDTNRRPPLERVNNDESTKKIHFRKENQPKNKITKNYKNNEIEYEDYNDNDNDYDNLNAPNNNNNNKKNTTTIESSGFSAAMNTISGIDNEKMNPNQNKITSRFIKNPNHVSNSTISRIDDSIDNSTIQKPQNQKPQIFPLPENEDENEFEEEEEENQIENELDDQLSDVGNEEEEDFNENEEEQEEESVLIGTINSDDEYILKNKSSRSQSSSSRGSQIKQIENIEKIPSKSSEVSQFDLFSDNKGDTPNKQICLKKVDLQNSPASEKYNDFSNVSNGTTSSDIGDLDRMAKDNIINESSSSSSKHKDRANRSDSFSSEIKKEKSDFTSNPYEAFSTDSGQNYPSYKEISEKIQQASLISRDSLNS